MPASPSKSPGAQTVDRALRILRSFLSGSPRKSLQAIAQEQGLHKSIAFRLLRSLEEQGFVQQDPVTKEYRLGLTLLELGEAARAGLDMRQEALPFIAELVQQTGETAYLTVRSGSEAVCVEVQESPSAVRVAYRVGLRHPLHLGAAGKVLLAFEEEALGQFLLRRGQEMSPAGWRGYTENWRGFETRATPIRQGNWRKRLLGWPSRFLIETERRWQRWDLWDRATALRPSGRLSASHWFWQPAERFLAGSGSQGPKVNRGRVIHAAWKRGQDPCRARSRAFSAHGLRRRNRRRKRQKPGFGWLSFGVSGWGHAGALRASLGLGHSAARQPEAPRKAD